MLLSPVHVFLEAAGPPAHAEDPEALAPLLEAVYERARAAWPTLVIERAVFFARLGACLGPSAPAAQGLKTLHTDDLYLACACEQGDPLAFAVFDQALRGDLQRATARTGATGAECDEIIQSLRDRFFVKGALAKYSGRGQLRAWVRVTATRAAMAVVDARRPGATGDAEQILAQLKAGGDAELDLMRKRFAAELQSAFAHALAALDVDDRVVLAQHYVDGVSLDDLAAHQRVHRATIARSLARIRKDLQKGVRARLLAALKIDAAALDSLFRVVQTNLNVSIYRLLGQTTPR